MDTLPPLARNISAMSPDHRRLAFETLDEGVWVLDLATKRIDLRVPGHEWRTSSIAWSSDGSTLALLGLTGVVEIVDARSGFLRATLKTTAGTLTLSTFPGTVAFAAGNSVVVVALGKNPAELWPAAGGERIASLAVRDARPATAMALSRNGDLVALGDENGGVSVWKARTGECLYPLMQVPVETEEKRINALDFDPRGELLAIGGGDCVVRLWKLGSSKPMRELSHCDEGCLGTWAVGCVRFSADGSRLVTSSFGFWEARAWDVRTGDVLDKFDYNGGNPCPMPVWISSDGRYMTATLNRRTVEIGTHTPSRENPTNGPDWKWYRSDGDLVWGIVDGLLQVWKVAGGDPVLSLPAQVP